MTIDNILTLIALLVVFWVPVTIFCPRIKVERNFPSHITAMNTVYSIRVNPDIHNLEGVIAQEYYESKFKHNPINLIRLLFGSKALKREMELMGHEITILFSPPNLQEEERHHHAKSLVTYYKCFRGWNEEVVYEMLLEESPYAKEWIAGNISKVSDLVEKVRKDK